jgi:chemotaxis protein MotA
MISFVAVTVAIILEGAHFGSFVQVSALMLILGGTIGATLSSYSKKEFDQLKKDISSLFNNEIEREDVLSVFIRLWEKSRRDGILSIEEDIPRLNQPLMEKGLRLVVDGSDTKVIEEILLESSHEMEMKEKKSAAILETAGGFAPTIGIIGTVLGLVHVLENLGGSTQALGKGIATAFIATFYGIAMANLVLLPLSNQLKSLSEKRHQKRMAIIRGILSLHLGENKRILSERVSNFLN